MRYALWLIVFSVLVGCGGSVVATPIAADVQVPPQQLAQIGRGDFDGLIVTIVAPVIQRQNGRVLVPALSLVDEPTPLLNAPTESVVLGGDPLEGLQPAAGGEYGVLRATGIIQVGGDGTRQLQPSSSKVLAPTRVKLADLQTNTAVYQNQAVEIQGTLIVKPGAALLVEEVGQGGVPTEQAAQIKIDQPFVDTALIERLPQSSGNIRYGPVTVVGVWRGKALTVFWAK